MGDLHLKNMSVRTIASVVTGILLVAAFAVMLSGENAADTQDSSAVTALFSAPTSLAEDPERCKNVKDWNFFNSEVTANNLGGVGPNFSDKQEIRYSNVANEVDLVVTIDKANQKAPYAANNGAITNGVNGKFGQVNVLGGTSASLTFTLVEAGTEVPVYVAPDQKVFFSVYDLDNSGPGKPGKPQAHEYSEFTTELDSYKVTPTTTIKVTGDKKSLQATSGRQGNEEDNPTDPLALTQVQMDSTVWVTYQGRNTWGMTFGESNNPKHKAGRNLAFAGRAQGDCPPGPVPPPSGACASGIEGMIKGGGRVCCPKECGNSDGPYAKFSEAPHHCGGPACDKGTDGVRTTERYNNCCVGKPVTGATSQTTITAPYGIVKQGRFCDQSSFVTGSDAPPCINRLSRVDNP